MSAYEPIRITRGNLPHWSFEGRTYFVTFRLHDSLPLNVIRQIDEEYTLFRSKHPEWDEAQAQEQFSIYRHNKLERYLDSAHGSCVLQNEEARRIVSDAIFYYHDNGQYRLLNFVVMPNHVHLLFGCLEEKNLQTIIASIKRFTAVRINRLLGQSGPLWQREYFDRCIRSEKHLARTWTYIRNNPLHAAPHSFTYWSYEMGR